MNRVSINYLNRFKEDIADASGHLRRLVQLHSDDKQSLSTSKLVGIAIVFEFTA